MSGVDVCRQLTKTRTPTRFPVSKPVAQKIVLNDPGCPVQVRLLDRWGDGWDNGAHLFVSNAMGYKGDLGYKLQDTSRLHVWPPVDGIAGKSEIGYVLVSSSKKAKSVFKIISENVKKPKHFWEVSQPILAFYLSCLTFVCLDCVGC